MNHIISTGQLLRRSLNKSTGLWAISLITSLLPIHATTAQSNVNAYRKGNSDWWSYTGRADLDDDSATQKRELSPKHFEILGLKPSDDIFLGATKKLGKAAVVQRGDASSGRSQICYSSAGTDKKVYLIFEKGELNDAFYLFTGGPDWEGSNTCTVSNLVTRELATASGLHLGLSATKVRALLGEPSFVDKGKMIYSTMIEKKTSAADFEILKKGNPNLGDDELHKDYEFFTLTAHIEARFQQDKLVYLAVSQTESY